MKHWMLIVGLGALAALVGLSGATRAGEDETEQGQGDTTALPDCPVMGEPVSLAVSTPTDDGPVFFCCKGCIKKFNEEPEKFGKLVAEQRKILGPRPKVQVVCPVSGKPVDSKFSIEHEGKTISFCCADCGPKYKENSAKYTVALANAYAYQTKCPVSGKEIDPKSFSKLPTGETVYFCSGGCEKKFLETPEKFAPKLAEQGVAINVEKLKEALEKG